MSQNNRTPSAPRPERSRASKIFGVTMMTLVALASTAAAIIIVGLGGALLVAAWRWAFTI